METIKRLPTHPGDVLKEEIESRGISQKKFAELLGVPYTQLNEILNGKRPVSTDFALMVEAALGITPELLINMQSRYNMALAKQKPALHIRLLNIRKMCAAIECILTNGGDPFGYLGSQETCTATEGVCPDTGPVARNIDLPHFFPIQKKVLCVIKWV